MRWANSGRPLRRPLMGNGDMADDEDNDAMFLEFIERLGPQCKAISTLIDTKIAEALRAPKSTPAGQSPQSQSYLEAQNQMLLAELLKTKGMTPQSIPQNPPAGDIKTESPTAPAPQNPPKTPPAPPKRPFFR